MMEKVWKDKERHWIRNPLVIQALKREHKLEMNKFPGNPISCHPIWESFESAIHKNTNLNDVDKFQYLKSLLEGSAAETISGLALTSSYYGHAVEPLTKHFGSKQVII